MQATPNAAPLRLTEAKSMLPRAEIMVQASVAVIRVIAELLPSMAELSRQQATATVRASVAEN